MAIISLAALVIAIALGYFRRLNTGVISIGFAFLVGRFGMGMSATELISGWPLTLFFVLLGMTFLFSIAGANGTLRLIARKCTFFAYGRRRIIPPLFFTLAAVLAACGPGNIAICALLLPIAMAVSREEQIAPLLMATMVITGSNAGGLSPIAPTGIIGVTLAKELGLTTGIPVFVDQIVGQGLLAAILYVVFRGHRLANAEEHPIPPPPFSRRQKITMLVVSMVVAGIVIGKWHIGLTAFLGAGLLLLCEVVDEEEAISGVPWSTLILVCGVGMLVNVCRLSGGIDTLTNALVSLMNKSTAAPIMAATGGLMSMVSSASGVVMPTLIPTVPRLAEAVEGDATRIISAIIMGAQVVSISPISTLGALAVASAGKEVDKHSFFRGLLLLAFLGLLYSVAVVFVGIV